jgi:hypothetical protein
MFMRLFTYVLLQLVRWNDARLEQLRLAEAMDEMRDLGFNPDAPAVYERLNDPFFDSNQRDIRPAPESRSAPGRVEVCV